MDGSVFVFDPVTRAIAQVSSLSVFILFSAYTIAYLVLQARYSLPAWTTAAAFSEGRRQPWFKLLTFCQVMAFATPLCFVVFVAALDAAAVPRFQAVTRIALAAAVGFAVLSSVHYFVQFVLAAHAPDGDRADALEQLYQLNPKAMIAAVNILGWTLFFALACLFLAPLVRGSVAADVTGWLLALNGVVCLLGMIGYLWRVRLLNLLYFNGMGLAVLAFSLTAFLVL